MEWNMDIVKAEFVVSNATVEKCPKPDRHEYAFIGRSNVGKSSLINMLTNNKKLAKTAARPGKTQLINHFLINDMWYMVDWNRRKSIWNLWNGWVRMGFPL